MEGLLCSRCMPIVDRSTARRKAVEKGEAIIEAYSSLVSTNSLLGLWEHYLNVTEFRKLNDFFVRTTGFEPRPLQKYWLFRMANGESFSLSAPTGMGKTTTLMVYSAFAALSGKKVLFVVPTASLRDQVARNISRLVPSIGDALPVKVVTVTYMIRNSSELREFSPGVVVLDDADALLKSGKSTDKLVEILGYSEDIYEDAIELARLKAIISVSKEPQEELVKRVQELTKKLEGVEKNTAQLLVASATLRPKGLKQRALRELVNFDLTTVQLHVRNVVDAFTTKDIAEVLKTLGDKTLVLVSKDKGKAELLRVKEVAENLGLKVGLAVSGRKFLEKFSRGEYDVLIGYATHYGVAVRGIDEPRMIYNVVFDGVPKIRLNASDYLNNPINSIKVLLEKGLVDQRDVSKFLRLSYGELNAIRLALKNGSTLTGKLSDLLTLAKDFKQKALEVLRSEPSDAFAIGFTVFRKTSEGIIVEIPDHSTYIQGSGRSSRLTPKGLTLGLALTVVDNPLLYEMLMKRLKLLGVETDPVEWDSINYADLRTKMVESREKEGREVEVRTALMVVESPTKARTIAKLFGRSSSRTISGVKVYETIIPAKDAYYVVSVVATKGHLTDLTTDNVGYYGLEIEGSKVRLHYEWLKRCKSCGRSFSSSSTVCPYCGSEDVVSSERIVKVLRRLALQVDEVLIATDPDVEGEKIAFDVMNAVKFFNPNVKRVTYHEVTKHGILSALEHPRDVDLNLVNAHLVRRVEDRVMGFRVSKALKEALNDPNNGSGRVQGPVLKWLAKRYQEYVKNRGYVAVIDVQGNKFRVFLGKEKRTRITVNVKKIAEEERQLNPKPPFTTDQLIEEASRLYGWSPAQVMRLAQDLFEMGLITYHRTDSTYVSSYGISIAKQYLESVSLSSEFSPRSWGEPGTHEAIRPTTPTDAKSLTEQALLNSVLLRLTPQHVKLYDLIFRRFVASQMRPANAIVVKYSVEFEGLESRTVELVESVKGGFSSVLPVRTSTLPEGRFDVEVKPTLGSAVQLMDYPEVIRAMKEFRIGRPSTYAKTIQTIIRHGYAVESKRSKKLVVTKKGLTAFSVISEKYPELLEERTTSELLDKIDKVAAGELDPEEIIRSCTVSDVQASLSDDSYNYV
jgi:reverse gyrase